MQAAAGGISHQTSDSVQLGAEAEECFFFNTGELRENSKTGGRQERGVKYGSFPAKTRDLTAMPAGCPGQEDAIVLLCHAEKLRCVHGLVWIWDTSFLWIKVFNSTTCHIFQLLFIKNDQELSRISCKSFFCP